jgi:hypothetical protein
LGFSHTSAYPPRVLSPQNRMHLTQSPRRASMRQVLRPEHTHQANPMATTENAWAT